MSFLLINKQSPQGPQEQNHRAGEFACCAYFAPLSMGCELSGPVHRIVAKQPPGVSNMKRILSLLALLIAGIGSQADEPKKLIGVAYGTHPRQVLDFYQAKSETPTPVVFYIHGGGWQNGDKKTDPKAFLDKGISAAAINYRFVKHGVEDKVEPPVKA